MRDDGDLKVLETKILIESMEDRAKVYTDFRDKIDKLKKAFFFPKEWDRVQVLKAIEEAFNNKRLIGDNKYSGKSESGLIIEMYLNKDGSIATAYPIYKGD